MNIWAVLWTDSQLKTTWFWDLLGLMISKDVTFVHCHCPVHIVHMPEMHLGLRYELRLKYFPGHVPLWPTIQLFSKCDRWKRWKRRKRCKRWKGWKRWKKSVHKLLALSGLSQDWTGLPWDQLSDDNFLGTSAVFPLFACLFLICNYIFLLEIQIRFIIDITLYGTAVLGLTPATHRLTDGEDFSFTMKAC